MPIRLIFIIVLVTIYLLLDFSLFSQELKFSHLNVKGGLSNNAITSLLQDSKGFMWIGTTDGLNKYDGYNFEIYRHQIKNKYSLQSNYIYYLYEDKNQAIWVGTNGGGLYKYESKYNRFIKNTQIQDASVRYILEDTELTLWVAADNMLFQMDKATRQFKPFHQFTKDNINAFLQVDKDWFAVATGESGLYLINTKTGQYKLFNHHENNTNSLCNNTIRSIYQDKEGKIWIGTANGLDRFDKKNLSFEHFSVTKDKSKGVLINSILSILGKDNDIWVGTENGGLSRYNLLTKQFTHYLHENTKQESISDNAIYSIHIDKQNRLWAGTFSNGVNIADPNSEKFSKPNLKLKNQTVNAILKDSKGRIWVGTEEGLSVQEGENTYYYAHDPTDKNSLPSNPVLEIFEDNQNRIWIGTWTGGLSLFQEDKKKFFNFAIDATDPTQLPNANILDILQSSKSQQLLLASFGGFHLFDEDNPKKFTTYTSIPADETSISGNQCRLLYEDSRKMIWIGTNQGLNRFDINTKKFKRFVHKKEDPNSISHNGIRSLFEDSKRNLWIGTVDGLNKMVKEGIFTTYTTIDGLPSNTINAILEDKEGNLWLSTNNGISCFNSQKQTFRNYDESDGLQSNQFKSDSYFQSKDGEIYFGGVNGLNAFYPDRIKDNPNLPAIFFTDFKLFNQSVKIGDYDSLLKQHISTTKEIVLNHTQTIFSIEYVALNLTQPHKNQYAYLLEGLEKNWNYVGTQRSATYTSLDAGSYIFRVKASNNDKIWNEIGISLKITILPPWWATWWFRLMILSLIAVSAYSFYKARTNFLKKQNFKLERLVSERTQQVIERTKEIEKKSKELELANYQIQAKNKELLSSEEELRQNMEELETSQDLLREQKHTIEFAFTQLHKQNTKVNDSIRYAQRIQNAILPHENILASSFSEYFVIFKPKDVVSGDFYWYFEVDIKNEMLDVGNQSLTSNINPLTSKKFLAVVDCTGHGVPGAFMSMIGNTLLNEIITVKNIFEPHLVLEYLHIGILNSLNKKDGRMQDGMDIALCCIENQENGVVNIQFSGAKRQLYYFSDQVLGELQSTKASIGQSYFKGSYTSQNLTLKSGDILYMTTDGWIDAINQERTRFGSRRLKEMLIKGANLPLPTQKELFISILDDYEQGAEQRDDILMVGVRL